MQTVSKMIDSPKYVSSYKTISHENQGSSTGSKQAAKKRIGSIKKKAEREKI